MTATATDLSAVLDRLDKLERQNRWLKASAGLMLLVGTAFALLSQSPSGQAQAIKGKSLEAGSFILRDSAKKVRAALSMGKEGPMLAFYDVQEKQRLALAAEKDFTGLNVYDGKGKRPASWSSAPPAHCCRSPTRTRSNACCSCSLPTAPDCPSATPMRKQILLKVGPQSSGFVLLDAKGTSRVEIGLVKDGVGLVLKDAKGKPVFAQQAPGQQ